MEDFHGPVECFAEFITWPSALHRREGRKRRVQYSGSLLKYSFSEAEPRKVGHARGDGLPPEPAASRGLDWRPPGRECIRETSRTS